MKKNMTFENLFILVIIPQLWLRKIIASAIGLLITYPIILYNRESAFLLSLLFATFVYKTLKKMSEKKLKITKDINIQEQETQRVGKEIGGDNFQTPSGILDQFIAGLFCICLVIFADWQDFISKSCLSVVFISIYDYYKPSLIRRLYAFDKDRTLGFVLGGILNGVLSGVSVVISMLLLEKVWGYFIL
ncbi:hypothetical protein LS73_004840 [Helicobacter muridarum]|uniref:Phosphatidylglycerophosphatase A n=1 Tax=Helicobacter muridarum TaxID=216 RepID=A0A099TX86_9HELI|nr:hypothetical protein [Helicobacter muridarum]TLE00318.1 hypothetical protein LS73_004840 [Helicobacter muridarum]STQ85815.1 phosphatidylglycerophosphatase A [Helicobacter muridarum]